MTTTTSIPAIQSWSAAEFVSAFGIKSATPAKQGPVAILMGALTKEGTTLVLVVAKTAKIAVGDKLHGKLTIVRGANAQGEERLYVTDKEGMFSADDFEDIVL